MTQTTQSCNVNDLHIRFTNTLTRKCEPFVPLNPNSLGMYVCGPTVYDRPHIGNVRSAVAFDILYRFLEAVFPKVTYVRNVTDVDDKINARSLQLGCSILDLTTMTLAQYHEDLDQLFVLRPTIEPRATEHITHMLDLIAALIEKGHAYEAEGHVLFDVSTFKDYGKLSLKKQEDLIAGARVEVAPYKKNPSDFVLWKPSVAPTPGWDSPYGFGRPGWHIECSAMSKSYLGDVFDIHAGGIDLTFPHHENEIAQSCCGHGTDYMARYWLHNGHVTIDGAKMSKSDGNFITAYDLLQKHDAEVLRFVLISTQYHQPLDWTNALVTQAKNVLDRFYGALQHAWANMNISSQTDAIIPPQSALQALADDLNVPAVLALMHEWANHIFKDEDTARHANALWNTGKLLGLFNRTPDQWFKGISDDGDGAVDIAAVLDNLIQERAQAKINKDFKRADEIRGKVDDMGYVLLDTPQGTTWRKK